MNDEIKEILDKPKILMLSYGNYISLNDYVKLKDYITNLQQEIQRKDAYIKYLEEYNPKYYKGEKFYGIEGDDENEK